jgi:TonB family protein
MKTIGSLNLVALLHLLMLFASVDVQDVCAEQVTAKPLLAVTVPSIRSTDGLTRLSWYLDIVQDKIIERWVPPSDLTTSRDFYSVLKFKLDRSGRISDVAVAEGSGDASFDEAGKLAARAVGVLPPLPPFVTEESLEIKLSFTAFRGIGNDVPAQKHAAKLALSLHANESSWVVVQVDDGAPGRVLLRAGEWMTWKAQKRFMLSVPDAGNIRGELNGKPLAPFGQKGEIVRDIVITE